MPSAAACARAGSTRRKRASGSSWLELVGRGVLELVPSGALIQSAADLSVELRHPLVDCLYVALAIQRSADLVTADAVLARRAAPSWPRVRLLATDR